MSTEAMKLAIAKEALEKLAKLGNGDRYGNSIGNSIAMEALDKMAENARELGLSYEQPHCEAGPEYCPECKTEAEKTAFAFGWFKALESVREQPAPAQQCVCGEPETSGTHRIDGPCYAEQPAQQEPDPDELTIAYMSGIYEGKKIGAKEEREACAKVAENGLIGHTIAKAIRARGNT